MKIVFHRLILVLAVLLLTTLSANAVTGDLDPGFSSDGRLDAIGAVANEYGRKVGSQTVASTEYLIIAGHVAGADKPATVH